nr:MAG TPA: winged helix-turn-helix DNA-binding protein [Caudoviricetes sp.]DAY08761.1 MAG TPA: winged helix-turn-helix DNA-binding protein [Caudoviricetes sp.]
MTLSALSRNNGLHSTTLANAFSRPYPKAERIIADAIGLSPQEIWPSRY